MSAFALLLMLAANQQAEQRFFETRVAPILARRCVPCHNNELKNGNVSFLDRESLIAGGSRGAAVVPGKPEQSVMIQALRHEGELQMPPGPKLPAKEIRVLTEWVRRGAVWGR
ncbi:MAG TPA: c-type cytochrome domain-containing protein [Bryobacteraceae bacterium]|nr:c-type cytochrome domain-containing protein [Bryobacteraceae bacterium]